MVVGADYSRLAAVEFSVGFLLNGGLRQRRVPSPSHWLGCYWFCSSKGCVGLLRFLRRAPFKKSGHLPNLRRNFLERWLMWLILAGMTSTSIARRPLSGMRWRTAVPYFRPSTTTEQYRVVVTSIGLHLVVMSATSQRLSSHCYPLAAMPRGSSLGLVISRWPLTILWSSLSNTCYARDLELAVNLLAICLFEYCGHAAPCVSFQHYGGSAILLLTGMVWFFLLVQGINQVPIS
uniref:Uncharacterized protein n=1 Tax=Oryza nivara TaxID=4536 RepID=A0A0E0IH77_ORYNI